MNSNYQFLEESAVYLLGLVLLHVNAASCLLLQGRGASSYLVKGSVRELYEEQHLWGLTGAILSFSYGISVLTLPLGARV